MSPAKRHRPAKRSTIHDVAREANVSTGTVSRALNNSEDVNAETREQVLAIARRLGMRPRAAAKRTHFALIMPERTDVVPGGFVEDFVHALLHELSVRGSALSVFTGSQAGELGRWIFDGIFSVTWSDPVLDFLRTMRDTPVVVINRFQDSDPLHAVGWDHVAEGRLVAEYLLGRGNRRLAFVAVPPINEFASPMRLQGFREACLAADSPLIEQRVELLEDRGQLFAALQRVVRQGADAVFIPGLGRHAVEAEVILQTLMKLRVPEDISVVGGESPGWSAIATPPLTTVHVPIAELAARAVAHMHALLDGQVPKKAERFLAARIIERKSVAERRG